jgi:hypothetical protein
MGVDTGIVFLSCRIAELLITVMQIYKFRSALGGLNRRFSCLESAILDFALPVAPSGHINDSFRMTDVENGGSVDIEFLSNLEAHNACTGCAFTLQVAVNG